jgi:hypothetical protein
MAKGRERWVKNSEKRGGGKRRIGKVHTETSNEKVGRSGMRMD